MLEFSLNLTRDNLTAMAPGFAFKTTQLNGLVLSADLVTPENKESFLGVNGWATKPLTNKDLQSLAKILSGSEKLLVCFACRLTNGQNFVAIASRPLYDRFYAEALRFQLATPSNIPQAIELQAAAPIGLNAPAVTAQSALTVPQSPYPTTPAKPQAKKGTSVVAKGCLGCLSVFCGLILVMAIIGAIFGTTPNNSATSPKTVAKITKPKPQPTETPTQKRAKLAREKKSRQEEQARIKEEEEKRVEQVALAEATEKKQKKAIEVFSNLMNRGSEGQLFDGYSVSGNDLTLKVADNWYSIPYQVKIDRLKLFHVYWAKTLGFTDDPTKAGIKLESATGTEIGGWNSWSGHWVEKD